MPKTTHRPLMQGDPGARNDACCWPNCYAEPGPIEAPLCTRHLAVAYRIYRVAGPLACLDMAANNALDAARAEPIEPLSERTGVIYFVRFQALVKIGFTTNMQARMTAVPHEEVLAMVPGMLADEKRCHAAFAHLRVHGEWFRAEPDLMAFIADVRVNAA